MPVLSAFTPIGLLELNGAKSEAERAYDALANMLGGAFDLTPGTDEQAHLYALAMEVAWARKIVQRVPRELHPLTCHDLLTTLEKDWACVPLATDTLFQRQSRIAARKLLMRGSREEALVADLKAAIGADFLKINACPTASAANYPTTATDVGTFPNPNVAPKFYKATTSVPVTGMAYAIDLTAVNSSSAPLVGEKLTIEPDIAGNAEAVTITGVTAKTTAAGTVIGWTVTATFTKAHSAGAWCVTAAPLWLSNRYQLQIVVSDAASRNGPKRKAVHGVMQRHAKSCEVWCIAAASSSADVGPFVIGPGLVGATVVGDSAAPF